MLKQRFDLGFANGHQLSVSVYVMTPHAALSRFSLRFCESRGRSQSTVRTVETPTNFVNFAKFETGRLLGNGRMQLLMAVWNGRCFKKVYDFNGVLVRTVFSKNDGRVDARIVHNEGSLDVLALYYPFNQWNSRLSGNWYYLPTFGNMVTLLAWKHGEFQPVMTGEANPYNVLTQFGGCAYLHCR